MIWLNRDNPLNRGPLNRDTTVMFYLSGRPIIWMFSPFLALATDDKTCVAKVKVIIIQSLKIPAVCFYTPAELWVFSKDLSHSSVWPAAWTAGVVSCRATKWNGCSGKLSLLTDNTRMMLGLWLAGGEYMATPVVRINWIWISVRLLYCAQVWYF